MFRTNFEEGDAILFKFRKERKFRIHTFFVFFSIDLIYLDEDFKILEIKENLSPFWYYNPDKKAYNLIELPGKVLEGKNIEGGDRVKISK